MSEKRKASRKPDLFPEDNSKTEKPTLLLTDDRNRVTKEWTDKAYAIIDDYAKFLIPRAEKNLRERTMPCMRLPMDELRTLVKPVSILHGMIEWNVRSFNMQPATEENEDHQLYWYLALENEPFFPIISPTAVDLSEHFQPIFCCCRSMKTATALTALVSERSVVRRTISGYMQKAASQVLGQCAETLLVDHDLIFALTCPVELHFSYPTDNEEDAHNFIKYVGDSITHWAQVVEVCIEPQIAFKRKQNTTEFIFKIVHL